MKSSLILSRTFSFLLVVIALYGCNDQPVDDGRYNVSGRVDNIKLTDAPVKLELSSDQTTHRAQVDEQGNYQFTNIIPGDYTLRVSQTNEAGSTVERTTDVNVSNSDQTLDVILPTPLTLTSVAHTTSDITLNWSLCTDGAFREYKVYKGYNPGLDETTGSLIYVSTDALDTTIVDENVDPNTEFYYRTFILDDRGRLAGSNVLKVKTDTETELYTLTLQDNVGVAGDFGEIGAVTFDGSYLWLARRAEVGGFYDHDRVTLEKYDLSDFSLVNSFTYTDRYERVGGLTFDGQYLWLQYTASGTGSNLIYKIDPATGARLTSYVTPYGVSGLSYLNNELYLNFYYDKIEKWNPLTGALISSNTIAPFSVGYNGSNGIAVKPGEIWISRRLTTANTLGIAVLNDDFTVKGLVKNPFEFAQLCFANNKLVLATDNRVYFYTVTTAPQ